MLRVNGLQVFVDALLSFYGANELLGLFLFLFIEEAGVPLWFLPGDVLVMLAGSRPGRTPGSVAMILLAATAGVSIGSSLLYLVVRCGGPPLLDRYGHFLHLDTKRIATVEAWFHRYGPLAIMVGRLVPGLRTPTTVMAATFQVPYRGICTCHGSGGGALDASVLFQRGLPGATIADACRERGREARRRCGVDRVSRSNSDRCRSSHPTPSCSLPEGSSP